MLHDFAEYLNLEEMANYRLPHTRISLLSKGRKLDQYSFWLWNFQLCLAPLVSLKDVGFLAPPSVISVKINKYVIGWLACVT